MGTLRAVLARHPRLVDAGLAVALALFTGPAVLRRASADEWLWFVAVHMPIVWRRRWPVGVFWTVFGLAIVAGAVVGVRVEGLYPESVVTVAVYTAARYGPRRQLIQIVAAIEVPALVVFISRGPYWTALGFITSVLAATVLLGITVRTRQAYLAELEERARIARDMHDIVAHNLAVMVALADGAALTAAAAPQRAADTMHKVAATGREALGEMRRVLGLMREDGVGRTPRPGLDGLDALVERVRAAGVRVALTVEGVPGEWGAGAGVAVYRVVQEALTNTLKHAGPEASAHVRLRYRDGGAEVEVTDDGGQWATAPAATGGHGLTGMAERTAANGGGVEAGPRDGAPGWRVLAHLRFDDGVSP